MRKNKDENINIRRTAVEKTLFIAVFLLLLFYVVLLLVFFGWGALTSLRNHYEYIDSPVAFVPFSEMHFDNYLTAFNDLDCNGVNMFAMIINTVWQTLLGSILTIFTTLTTGYIFAHYKFKGKGLIFSFVIFTMIIPTYGALASQYKLIYSIGINDSPLYFITALSGFSGMFLIVFACFKGVSKTYAEAAFIDGCGHLKCYLIIMLPMVKGLTVTLFIQSFMAGWNDYTTALYYLNAFPTIALGLFEYQALAMYEANVPVYLAGVIISMIPCILIFSFFNEYITKNLMVGGLKG